MREKKNGFTMIEVLVAMLVLSIGLLGMAAMTVVVMRSNALSQQMSEATNIASTLMDRLKFQPAQAFSNAGVKIVCATTIPSPSTCTPISESGVFSAAANAAIFYPPATATSASCSIPGVIENANPMAEPEPRAFDIVTANGVKVGGDLADNADLCTLPRPDQGQYLRYYKVSDAPGAEVTLAVVVLWVDKFGKWRHVKFSTTRVP